MRNKYINIRIFTEDAMQPITIYVLWYHYKIM